MEREQEWQEQGGGEQTDEGGPSGADVEPADDEGSDPSGDETAGV